jgi:predicted ATP-grasp superfamily ATP-dependent carboligase
VGDLILLVGTEPQLRWRTFCAEITQLAIELGVGRVIHLGALLAEIPHSRPVPVTASGTNLEVLEAERLPTSHYEGPTGIVGVLQDACRADGIPAVSLWAPVPHYVSSPPNPVATRALLARLGQLAGLALDLRGLDELVNVWRSQVDRAVDDNSELEEYIASVEEQMDELADDDDDRMMLEPDPEDAADLAEEVERFLREHEEGA